MQTLDFQTFYAYVRRAPFGNGLSQKQVDGLQLIVTTWRKIYPQGDRRHLAYILATAFHEVSGTMQPIREIGGDKYLSKYDTGRLAKNLGNTPEADGDGQKYAGRGYVQLTGRANYLKAGNKLGLKLIDRPELALVPENAVRILIFGMVEGWFTGRKLSGYFNASLTDAKGARAIVNGSDKASLIAGYFKNFLDALDAAYEAGSTHERPDDVTPEMSIPDDVAPTKTKSFWAIIGSYLTGGGLLTVIGAINNPWAFAALVVFLVPAAIGAYWLATGRIDIKRLGL